VSNSGAKRVETAKTVPIRVINVSVFGRMLAIDGSLTSAAAALRDRSDHVFPLVDEISVLDESA